MITTNLQEVEPELNKNEKIIFEYLLNELEISNSKSLKLSLNSSGLYLNIVFENSSITVWKPTEILLPS